MKFDFQDLLARFGTKLLGNLNYDSCDTVSKMRLIELNNEMKSQPIELVNPLHQLDYIDLCRRRHRRLVSGVAFGSQNFFNVKCLSFIEIEFSLLKFIYL